MTRVHLQLTPHATVLRDEGGNTVTMPAGLDRLVDDVLRHDPPTPLELERAIDVIEEALAGWRDARSEGGVLVTADARVRALPGLEQPGSGLDRDAVEALFERLASRARGLPDRELPPGREAAAALLVVRECMHHLGLERLAIDVS